MVMRPRFLLGCIVCQWIPAGFAPASVPRKKGSYLAAGYVGRELGAGWYENPARQPPAPGR